MLTHLARKFVAKFGCEAFMDSYYPQYELRGKKHLPGLRFVWDDDSEHVKRKRKHRKHIAK